MKVTAEQIEKFFKKQCTAGEAMQVAAFLKTNSELLDKYLSEAEWDETETDMLLPDDFWNETWKGIQQKKQQSVKAIWLKRSAVAACALTMVCFSYYFITNKTKTNIEANKKTATENSNALAGVVQRKIIENTTKKILKVLLQDSSGIVLSPHALISYDVPFAPGKREIFLKGEAIFKVAHDKTKPFTVYTGSLATTALGTEFKITTNVEQKHTTVKLFKGKVVIKSTEAGLKGWSKNIYLQPGEQMEYNADNKLVAVTAIPHIIASIKKHGIKLKGKNEQAVANTNLVFTSTPLPNVLNKLSVYFDQQIVYDAIEINTMNFTGTITKNDSLPIVLKLIAQMNELEVLQDGDCFTVKEMQQ